MLLLSSSFASLIEIFAPLFDSRVWSYAELLLVGAVLAPGKRTVSSVLRIVGLGSEKHFQNYHRVLNRTRWSGRAASQILLGLLLRAFSPCGPILVGLDDTIAGERREARGATPRYLLALNAGVLALAGREDDSRLREPALDEVQVLAEGGGNLVSNRNV